MRTEKVSLTQHDRLMGLLAELEQEKGPIAAEVMEEVCREWPVPKRASMPTPPH